MNTSDGPVRVLLAGDCPLLRSGFRQVLEAAGMTVVGSVDSPADVAALLETTAADVIVVGTVTSHGSDADAREILEAHPSIPLLVLGRTNDADGVRAALAAGARGYLGLERAVDGDLIQAVRSLAAGEMYLSPELAASHASAPAAAPVRPAPESPRLTERERQVLTLVARGRSNREIAEMLGLSANTVAVHRANLMKTLAVRKTASLVLYAVRHGLVTAD
jgi:DNA-binding NarL/FixJ family response regulator